MKAAHHCIPLTLTLFVLAEIAAAPGDDITGQYLRLPEAVRGTGAWAPIASRERLPLPNSLPAL